MQTEIEKAYEAEKYEDGIYKKWEDHQAFFATVDQSKESYTISMPPPNATGTLHLGHAVMIAIQDILTRRERMLGKSALWLPGTDHAAIATQSVVEKKLQESGIAKPREELGREKLLEEIRNFVADSKSTIKNQIRKMGASCDWSKEKYTLDDDMNHAVNTVFKMMYEDGLIYRGGRIVNWDPNMQTTVADDEIEYVEEKAKFYYFQYGPVVIGTARPETKFLDKIIVVHPDDPRYQDLIGKEFEVEWIEGKIKSKVIADPCIDMKLGTGAMTITPAHSQVDFELAETHNLEATQIIDFDGNIRQEVSEDFGGLSVMEAREKIVERLKAKGLLVKIDEEYIHSKAVNYRGKGIIEPQIMKQWFIDVNKKVIDWKGKKCSIKEVLQDVVRSKMIKVVPERFEKIYFGWIDNLRDWCISRQIWWGHQIPIWYKVSKEQYDQFHSVKDASSILLTVMDVDGEVRYGVDQPAGDYWIKDPDTLDTWFSSALWTFATLGWPEKTEALEYFHPTDVLETGYDIIFFWVARMILSSTYALRRDGFPEEKCIPFKTIYLHGLIRDRRGKKMSKSNPETCIDPLEMIEKYGADSLRLSLVIGSTPGNDMRLYEEKIAGYRNFINKIWNAARFTLMNLTDQDLDTQFSPESIKTDADKWIVSQLQLLIQEVDQDFVNYRLSDAGNKIYEFFWNQYCDWYLEMSKGENKNGQVLLYVLKTCLKLLHPFIPFVTEQLWSFTKEKELLIKQPWPKFEEKMIFQKQNQLIEEIKEVITQIRSLRSESNVEPAKKIQAMIFSKTQNEEFNKSAYIIKELARLSDLQISTDGERPEQSKSIILPKAEIYLPLKGMVDKEAELKRIEKKIAEAEKIIGHIESKLNNSGFTANAPKEVIEKQRKNLQEEQEKLSKLQEQKTQLQNLA